MKKQFEIVTDRFMTARHLWGLSKMREVLLVVSELFGHDHYNIDTAKDLSAVVVRTKEGTLLFEARKKVDARSHVGKGLKRPNTKSILAAIEHARNIIYFKRASESITGALLADVAALAMKELEHRAGRPVAEQFPDLREEVFEIVSKVSPALGTKVFKWTQDARKNV